MGLDIERLGSIPADYFIPCSLKLFLCYQLLVVERLQLRHLGILVGREERQPRICVRKPVFDLSGLLNVRGQTVSVLIQRGLHSGLLGLHHLRHRRLTVGQHSLQFRIQFLGLLNDTVQSLLRTVGRSLGEAVHRGYHVVQNRTGGLHDIYAELPVYLVHPPKPLRLDTLQLPVHLLLGDLTLDILLLVDIGFCLRLSFHIIHGFLVILILQLLLQPGHSRLRPERCLLEISLSLQIPGLSIDIPEYILIVQQIVLMLQFYYFVQAFHIIKHFLYFVFQAADITLIRCKDL